MEGKQKSYKKIEPLKSLSLVDKVELRLIDFIKENNLVPGDSIPKELEFAASLGVSRTVVREALLRLRTLGLIESKKHRGMVLTEPDVLNNFERVMDPTLLAHSTLKNLFELRLILEMGMADVIFARKSQKDMDELEAIVDAEEKANADGTIFSLDREVAFHGKLYDMSNNITLQRFNVMLLPIFEFVHEQEGGPVVNYNYSGGGFVNHRDLLDNIKVGTPETFRNAMRRHLEPHFDLVLRNFNRNPE